MKDLSVIIVNTNNGNVISQCLDSVFHYTEGLDYEVIVVDNGSTDGSREMLRLWPNRVQLIEAGANLGFSKANNRGMEKAQGRAVILLNSDTELKDNALKTLYDFLLSAPRCGACGGKLVYSSGAPQWSYGYYPSFPRMLWITLSGLLRINAGRKEWAVIPGDLHSPIPVEYICGADLMMKRSVLDQVGLLDERFFVYSEETDLCKRITEAGHPIWYLPNVEIIHHIEGSFRERKKMREIIYYTSLFKFLEKHYGYYRLPRWYLMAKFKLREMTSKQNTESYEDAKFRREVIRECHLRYPFEY